MRGKIAAAARNLLNSKLFLFIGFFFIFGSSLSPIIILIANRQSLTTTPAAAHFYSPVPDDRLPMVLAAEITPKKVFGYLPFWNLSEAASLRYRDLSLVYYFGATVLGDGSFDKTEPGWQRMDSPEFRTFQELAAKYHTRMGLTVLNMDQDNIAAVIGNPNRQKKVIDNTLKLMREQGFTDINVDFEYINAAPDSLVEGYNHFIERFTNALHQEIPGSTLTVATLSDAAWKNRIYNIKTISAVSDGIIVMTYDFNRLDSQAAGPIAPLFGKEKYQYDVYTTVVDYLRDMSAPKLVLGIPFYGYEWPTVDSKPNSFVLGYSTFGPAVSSYKRTMEVAAENKASINFDDQSKSPWFSYFDKASRTWRQVWFENERSLGLKLDLVNQANLGGIAIWALGYDGDENATGSAALWQTVRDKIRPTQNLTKRLN